MDYGSHRRHPSLYYRACTGAYCWGWPMRANGPWVMHQPFTSSGGAIPAGTPRALSQPLRTRTGFRRRPTSRPPILPLSPEGRRSSRPAPRHPPLPLRHGLLRLQHARPGPLDLVLESGLAPRDIEPLLPIIHGPGRGNQLGRCPHPRLPRCVPPPRTRLFMKRPSPRFSPQGVFHEA